MNPTVTIKHMHPRLLPILTASLGCRTQATQEFKWMKRAVDNGGSRSCLSLTEMVQRRSSGEPLQYILGTQPFGPLNLLTRSPVLIPRPETENWVLKLADAYVPAPHKPVTLLDLGTGSGCIPLLLCHLWPPGSLRAHGVDISPHALSLANDNADLCGIPHCSEENHPNNTFTTSLENILDASFPDSATRFRSPFDIITCNPPYIAWKDYLKLPRSVKDFEDPRALLGGPSGFDFYHAICRLLSHENLLKSEGFVALEVGYDQAEKVESLMLQTGRFRQTEIWLDPWEKQRTIIARM